MRYLRNDRAITFVVCLLSAVFALSAKKANAQQSSENKTNWVVKHPFTQDVFIENKGQFMKQEQADVGEKIMYATEKGKLHLYFTQTTLVFRYDSAYKIADGNSAKRELTESEEAIRTIRTKHVFLTLNWENANHDAYLEVQDETPDYYTYGDPNDKTGQTSILAHAWKKLIYHNLYNNIDVAFYFPAKGGIEYDIIAHPGADISAIKMQWTGEKASVNLAGNDVHINSLCANFIDHAPTAKDENGKAIGTAFNVHNNRVTFKTDRFDNSKALTIDPWLNTTSLGGANKAYDLDYDINGNVYIYGGGSTVNYKLQKYSNAGVLQWTYTVPFTYSYSAAYFYGGMCTDEHRGNSYITEGYDAGTGNGLVKVNNAGTQVRLYAGNPGEDECWKIIYDYCYNELVIGAGSNMTALQSAHVDTNLSALTAFNAYTAGAAGHDICLVAQDYNYKAYMATARSYPGTSPGILDNVMCQLPLPACTPTAYQVPDNHIFIEIGNVSYYPLVGGYAAGNGFNGMAAVPQFVVTYDGGVMRKWRSSNGAFLTSVVVSGTSYAWGGCDIDCGDKIYVGNNTSISVYDSNLTLQSTIAGGAGHVIYALKVYSARHEIYTAGNDFVQCTSFTPVCGPPLPCAVVLPIQLTDFHCETEQGGIKLVWTTATETNNKFFTISRSKDGVNFENIGTVQGAGNSSYPLNYSFTDDSPDLIGTYYYRLSQTDFDGQSVSFNITSCSINSPVGNVYPNPSSGKFSVTIDNTVKEVQVYNDLGQMVYNENIQENTGSAMQLDLSNQASGIYMLKLLQANQNTVVKKLIVEQVKK